jgi:2,4-dienoyl-CoA reductase (NADPH2)
VLDFVWRAGRIGPLELPHRVIMGSMHLGLEGTDVDEDGSALAAFYRERAEGGAALIVTGGSAVSRVGAGGRNYSFINDDAEAPRLVRVTEAVHGAGGRILLQLFHAGRYAYESSFGLQPVAPSAVYSNYSRCEPRALSHEEVLATIGDFARGAARARELGFDGVEIMGSEGYLLNQFMAPATNLRDDEWGGDGERRMRFPLEVAAAVRAACGPELAVVYRISGADLVAGGAAEEEVVELARGLAAGAVDALNVGIGWHEARVPTVQALVPHGAWRPWARTIREAVEAPVIASNRINTLALAEEALAAGDADFVSLARPFLADPEIVRKTREGTRAVNICIACNQACIDRSIFDRRVSCVVNPRAGYELELPRETAAALPGGAGAAGTRIAVVGGGPAGMEAARALAAAGHEVTLYESSTRLGGQFRMACRIPGKEDFARTIDYFEHELDRLGVTVALGRRIDDADALTDFDGVVVATGVTPRPIDLPGAELPQVHSYAELLLGEPHVAVGESVAIIGAGGIGVDVAHRLSHRPAADPRRAFYAEYGLAGMSDPDPADPADPAAPTAGAAASETPPRVTLMRRGARVGERMGPSTRWAVLDALKRNDVEILTGVQYTRIEPGAVVIEDAGGSERRVPAETVVVAAGQQPETALAAALREAGAPHLVIGGAADAAELDAERAFREGSQAPGALAQALGARSW